MIGKDNISTLDDPHQTGCHLRSVEERNFTCNPFELKSRYEINDTSNDNFIDLSLKLPIYLWLLQLSFVAHVDTTNFLATYFFLDILFMQRIATPHSTLSVGVM